jgi:2-C-methyl-D-erythritol 4-phosphate cytidylyltransferase/2-C-methyl-D-erythritol 2,4-cyclodiphosphate synthase
MLLLGGRSILQRSVEAFQHSLRVDDVVVALPAEMAAVPPAYLVGVSNVAVVPGGARRQDSVANAFAAAPAADLVVIHDAARPFVSAALIARTIDAAIEFGAAIAARPASDTVKRATSEGIILATLPREEIHLAQTPQAFRASVLRDVLAAADPGADATDEAALAERAGHPVRLVEGDAMNIKITTPEDLSMAEALLGAGIPALRVGTGYDLHRLVEGRPLILGGVTIPFVKGLQGHSDGDAVSHAVTDALLGAAGMGNIGSLFPSSDPAFEGADSLELLREATGRLGSAGYAVVNVDVTVIAERPKLTPHIAAMRANLAGALAVDPSRISVKGKTNEGVDSMGDGQSIAVHAVALVAAPAFPSAPVV